MRRFFSQLNFFDKPIARVLLARRKGSVEGKRSLFSSAGNFFRVDEIKNGSKMNKQARCLIALCFFPLLLFIFSSIYGRTKSPYSTATKSPQNTVALTISNTTNVHVILEIKQFYRGKADSYKIQLPKIHCSFEPKKTTTFLLPFKVGTDKKRLYFLARALTDEKGCEEGLSAFSIDLIHPAKQPILGSLREETETVHLHVKPFKKTFQKIVLDLSKPKRALTS